MSIFPYFTQTGSCLRRNSYDHQKLIKGVQPLGVKLQFSFVSLKMLLVSENITDDRQNKSKDFLGPCQYRILIVLNLHVTWGHYRLVNFTEVKL